MRRIATVVAGGVLALLVSLGLGTAYAAPTSEPGPAANATPAPSPSGSATSTSSVPSVDEVTPTPTASPSGSEPPSSPVPSAVEVPPTPSPPASLSAAETEDAAALAEPKADERFGLGVTTRCSGGEGETAVEVSLGLSDGAELTLDYVLTDDDDTTRTGTVSLPPGDDGVEFEVTGLPVGRYHVDFFEDGDQEPVAVQNLEILTCLVSAVQCRQVTFTNPATNPSVAAFYGEGPGKQEEFQDFDLEPGQQKVVRSDRGLIQWGSGTVEGGAGDNLAMAQAGGGDLVVPSDCGSGSPSPKPGDRPTTTPDDGSAGLADGLADTGASAYLTAGLVGGCLLTAAGVSIVRRRRPN